MLLPAEAGSALPTMLVASSLVVAGAVGALAWRRRHQLRHRRYGHRIAVPDDTAGRLEWLARRDPQVVDTAALDAALRSLQRNDWLTTPLPDLRAVRLHPDRATLTLASPASPPPPFEAGGDAEDWVLDADTSAQIDPDDVRGLCAPFPLLASVATAGEEVLLLDLEQLGALHVTGPPGRAANLLRHLAAELANSRWAEDVEILLVGFGAELVPLHPERLRTVPDVANGVEILRSRREAAALSVAELSVRSVLDGRIRDVAPDAWLPVLLLCVADPSPDEHDELDELRARLADDDRGAVALVTAGGDDTAAGHRVILDEDGLLTTTMIDDWRPWQGAGMTAETGAGVAAILAPTDRADEPVGPTQPIPNAPWPDDMDEDGTLHQRVDEPGPEPPPEPDHTEPDHPGPGDAGPGDAGLGDAEPDQAEPGDVRDGSTAQPDEAALRRLAIVDHQDPDLDRDVERWWSEDDPTVPMIAILGEPLVRAPGDLPSARPSWFTEVLVYLSLHPLGVTQSKATADLWPEGRRITAATVRHAFYGARRWAGRGYVGDASKAFVSDMQSDTTYRLRGHLLDWDLFRRLRKRAQGRHQAGHPRAVADYEAALRLVRGPVLSSLRHDGYAWLNNHDQRHDLQIPGFVVDTAHELVDITLAASDTGLARWAAERARLVDLDAGFDRPLTDLMRIAHAEDNAAEMERYAAVLLDARGFEVPEELPPETFAVLNELLPAGPRRARP